MVFLEVQHLYIKMKFFGEMTGWKTVLSGLIQISNEFLIVLFLATNNLFTESH